MDKWQNWLYFSFDGVPDFPKTSRQSFLDIHFNLPNNLKNLSYNDALLENASLMRDSFSEPFDVLLSGGIDSEVMVRTFKKLGIAHNTFIFKYENDLNIRDVKSAVDICDSINIPYKIIDFNLSGFFSSNESKDIFEKTLVPNLATLAFIKWMDYLDNIPIFGEGEPYWKRDLIEDYSKKSTWSLKFFERIFFITLTKSFHKRTAIGEWYLFTPYIYTSFHKESTMKDLLDDKIIGKQSNLTSRIKIHQSIWPEIKDKIKLSGFEGPTANPRENIPSFFYTFYYDNKMYDLANITFSYTLSEWEEICNQII